MLKGFNKDLNGGLRQSEVKVFKAGEGVGKSKLYSNNPLNPSEREYAEDIRKIQELDLAGKLHYIKKDDKSFDDYIKEDLITIKDIVIKADEGNLLICSIAYNTINFYAAWRKTFNYLNFVRDLLIEKGFDTIVVGDVINNYSDLHIIIAWDTKEFLTTVDWR